MVVAPQAVVPSHSSPRGPACSAQPYGFLWTGFDAHHEYDIYGHRRMAIRAEPKSGIKVEGLLNRRFRGCPNCAAAADPCGCNSRCTTSLIDALSYMRQHNCAGCGPRCNCPAPAHGSGDPAPAQPAEPAAPVQSPPAPTLQPAPQQKDTQQPTPPPNVAPTRAETTQQEAVQATEPSGIVERDREPQAVVAPAPESASSSPAQPDQTHLDDPPEPNGDVLQVMPTPEIPRNEIPQNVIPLRSSRRPMRERTLSAIRRCIRT